MGLQAELELKFLQQPEDKQRAGILQVVQFQYAGSSPVYRA